MTALWYYAQNGAQGGPIPIEELRAKLSSGALRSSDLVWSEGLPAWTPAGQVAALLPPPDPGPPPPPRSPAPPPPAYRAAATPAPAPAAAQAPREPLPVRVSAAPPAAEPRRHEASAPVASEPGGEVAGEVTEILRATRPWVRFLSILGFLGLGMAALGSIGILVAPMESMGSSSIGPKIAAALLYLAAGLLQLPSVLFLHRYASGISRLLASRDSSDLARALRAQKSFWKYAGVLTLTMMILGVLAIVGMLLLAGAGMLSGRNPATGL